MCRSRQEKLNYVFEHKPQLLLCSYNRVLCIGKSMQSRKFNKPRRRISGPKIRFLHTFITPAAMQTKALAVSLVLTWCISPLQRHEQMRRKEESRRAEQERQKLEMERREMEEKQAKEREMRAKERAQQIEQEKWVKQKQTVKQRIKDLCVTFVFVYISGCLRRRGRKRSEKGSNSSRWMKNIKLGPFWIYGPLCWVLCCCAAGKQGLIQNTV